MIKPILVLALGLAAGAGADTFDDAVLPLLDSYCLDCHDDVERKGDVSFEEIFTEEDALAVPGLMQKVRDALHYREMPPAEKDQPTAEEQAAVIAWVNNAVLRQKTFLGHRDPGAPAMRRLTRLEYNNTLRDLLGLREMDAFNFPERMMAKPDYFDPSQDKMPDKLDIFIPEFGSKKPALVKLGSIPGDSRAAHGFFNQGDKLDINPFRLERYIELATEVVNHPDLLAEAVHVRPLFGEETRAVAHQESAAGGKAMAAKLRPGFAPLDNIQAEAPGSSDQVEFFRDHIGSAYNTGLGGVFQNPEGKGEVKGSRGGFIRAEVGRRAVLIRPSNDWWFVDFSTAHETSEPSNISNVKNSPKVFDIDLEVESTRLDEGILSAGLVVLSRARSEGEVAITAHFASGRTQTLRDRIDEGAGKDNTFFSWQAPKGDAIVRLHVDGSKFDSDFVLMDDLAFIIGSSKVKAAALAEATDEAGAAPAGDLTERKRAFELFLTRAFRGPVTPEDVRTYWGFYEEALAAGKSDREAMGQTLRAIITAPRFLFMVEEAGSAADPVRRLDGFELANRLSYFLWATMPDDELFLSAASGALENDPAELERQVRRMLADPKVKELSDSFAFQWLQLNKLIGSQPDRKRYARFYTGGKGTMADDFIMEAQLLFETVLIENRPLMDLFDPDFTYMNPELIKFYGLEDHYRSELESAKMTDKRGNKRDDNAKWFRCELPDRTRGGVMAMGGPLTLSSLPLRSSPVYRGAWIAEVVFNRPPPNPPAMVDELGADDQSFDELTLREKLEQHRSSSACSGCHARIDPPGFALEAFDPIGRIRDSYGNGEPVDTEAVFKRDYHFDGIVGFKDVLRERSADIHRGFIRHLLTYALGRHLEPADEWAIDEIEREIEGKGLRDLVLAIARSYPFTHTRSRAVETADAGH